MINENIQRLAGIEISQSEGVVYEGGLARVWQKSKEPFAILTAFRANFTLKQNRNRNKQLESDLKAMKAGGIKLTGHWEEAPDGTSWEDAKKSGNVDDVVEESYFVPKPAGMEYVEFESAILKLTKKYNQDAAVIGDGSKVNLIFQDGSKDSIGSSAGFGRVAQAYSTIRGRPAKSFVFEGTIEPSSIAHRMALKRRGLTWASTIISEHDSQLIKSGANVTVHVIFDGEYDDKLTAGMVITSGSKVEEWEAKGVYTSRDANKLAKAAKAKLSYKEEGLLVIFEIVAFGEHADDLYLATEKFFGNKLKKIR